MTLTRDQVILAAVVAGVAVGVVLVSPWSPLVQKAAPEGLEGVTWSPSSPAGHKARGGLYHPPVCGQGRTGLIMYGWPWITNPPSELTGPGYQAQQGGSTGVGDA